MTTTATTTTSTPPTATLPISGLHHVSAITGNAQGNADFYTQVLGLRLVKVTVNYDDPTSYHLYYGDGLGRPGTIMTFFVWPGRRGTQGVGQVIETAFEIPAGTAAWWVAHLQAQGAQQVVAGTRFGTPVVTLVDPDGIGLALVESAVAPVEHAWTHGTVPAEVAIRGFHGVTLSEMREHATGALLTERFGYRLVGNEGDRVRYVSAAEDGVPGRVVDLLLQAERVIPRGGVGQVHHVAFRTPDDEQQKLWLETLRTDGHHVSPVMDRDYFHSIYFREPGGVLFEIATDGPGFTKNEWAEELGTHLLLPWFVERERASIEAALPRLRLAERVAV